MAIWKQCRLGVSSTAQRGRIPGNYGRKCPYLRLKHSKRKQAAPVQGTLAAVLDSTTRCQYSACQCYDQKKKKKGRGAGGVGWGICNKLLQTQYLTKSQVELR